MYTLLDNKGQFFASSVSLDAMMRLMRHRWAGTVVDQNGNVLFDITADRIGGEHLNVTAKMARAESDLAWSRTA